MDNTIVYLLIGVIGLVMLFAQLKLFTIDSTLRQILRVLQERAEE